MWKGYKMKRWEKIQLALEHPDRTYRARYMFELLEEERIIAVDNFKEYAMLGIIKTAVSASEKANRYKGDKDE